MRYRPLKVHVSLITPTGADNQYASEAKIPVNDRFQFQPTCAGRPGCRPRRRQARTASEPVTMPPRDPRYPAPRRASRRTGRMCEQAQRTSSGLILPHLDAAYNLARWVVGEPTLAGGCVIAGRRPARAELLHLVSGRQYPRMVAPRRSGNSACQHASRGDIASPR